MDAKIKLLLVCSIIGAFGCQGAKPPTSPPGTAKIRPPAIQPPAHFKPSRKPALSYFEKTTVEAYRTIGARNPKWDDNAEVALRLWAYQLCDAGSVVNGPEL